MRVMAVILTIILTICGKVIGNIILCYAGIKRRKHQTRLRNLEQFYQDNPSEIKRLLLELETSKHKLAVALSANIILKQQLEKSTRKHSCFCERLRILVLQLTHNLSPKDLESLLAYSYNTISSWFSNLKRYGLSGIIPRGQLPWPLKHQTSPEIVHLIWRIHDENPVWGRWRIAQTLWRMFLFISPSTINRDFALGMHI